MKPIIALDTRGKTIKMVHALDERDKTTPFICGHRRFHSLRGFQRYWQREGSKLVDIRVAVPEVADAEDPHGVADWVETQEVPLERYPWLGYDRHLNGEFDIWALPDSFKGAYTLALYASYRAHPGMVASSLWAKLFEVHYALEEIRHIAQGLTAAMPRPPIPDDPDEIPF